MFKKQLGFLAVAALLTSNVYIPASPCVNASEYITNKQVVVINQDDKQEKALQTNSRVTSEDYSTVVTACSDFIEEATNISDWNKQIINVESDAQNISHSSKVKIALIDSGVDYTNDIPIVERMNFIPGEEDVSPVYDDPTGHGTSIAGIIASSGVETGVTGINPNVELYSAKILGFDMQAPVSRVISAIDWAIEKNVKIINLSFGTPTDSPALHNAIKKAYDAGILIVAAAGNKNSVEYPAAYDEVIAVGSINSAGEISEESASGEELELVAPGEKVVSTSHFGGVSAASGTSMAAPHVVGIASLLYEKNLSVSNDFIRKVLDASANKISTENECGYGLIDYDYALEIYNSMLSDYEENKSLESYDIKENMDEVPTFNTEEIVEGSWSQSDHESMTSKAAINENLDTDYQILFKSIKAGSRANDRYVGGSGALTYAPQFHGWCYYGSSTNHLINYISCYVFMTDIAKYYYKNGSFPTSVGSYSYLDSADASMMLNALNYNGNVRNPINGSTASWQTIFNYYSLGNVTNARMCGFLYGMACHIATDTFAHSAYRLSGSSYAHILHDDGADLHGTSNNPERFDCAKEIAQNLVSHYYNGYSNKQRASVNDFVLSSYQNVINSSVNGKPSFKLRRIAQFAQAHGRGYSGDTYFTTMSY